MPIELQKETDNAENIISDRPSYFPPDIESERIPDRLRNETRFWTTGKNQQLSSESSYALMEAEAIMTGVYQSGVLQEMDLDTNAPGQQYINGHNIRVAVHSLLAYDKLKAYNGTLKIPSPRVLAIACLLHDIGKLRPRINRVIMSEKKYGEEALIAWQVIKEHPKIGAELAYAMPGLESSGERIRVAEAIYQHHENYDGTGYFRIKGSRISPEAQIIRMTDSIDAMGEPRPYKLPMDSNNIMAEVEKQARFYHPALIDVARKIQRSSGVWSRHRNSDRPQ